MRRSLGHSLGTFWLRAAAVVVYGLWGQTSCKGHHGVLGFQVRRWIAGDAAVARNPSIDWDPMALSNPQTTTPSQNHIELEALSTDPPLLISKQPILSPHECAVLSRHFNGNRDSYSYQQVLSLQDKLDSIICRPSDEASPQPRHLRYSPSTSGTSFDDVHSLLPDGLHVDTNNGHLFRYATILVYLTSSDSAATTFPLARPLKQQRQRPQHVIENGREAEEHDRVWQSAQTLLNMNHHHTRPDTCDARELLPRLEDAAYDLYRREREQASFPPLPAHQNHFPLSPWKQAGTGIRILPQAGYCTLFFSINDCDGTTDARSWHGSEALVAGDQKEILTFFYEIPMSRFRSQKEFGHQVAMRKKAILDRCERRSISVN